MTLELECAICSKAMRLADSTAGRTIICPRCGWRLRVTVADGGTHLADDGRGFEVVDGESRCPCCRAHMMKQAIVCIRCGYDSSTCKRPPMIHQDQDETEMIGSKVLGTWTEFIYRRDPVEGWVLIVDSWQASLSDSYARVVLRDYREAWITHFQTSADSGSMTLILVDYYGKRRSVYSGDSSTMYWLIDRLNKAGLEIKRG